jgi:hypothetical protein
MDEEAQLVWIHSSFCKRFDIVRGAERSERARVVVDFLIRKYP